MKNILITGGAGFIGSHVVRLFVNKYPGYRIVNLDKLTYAGQPGQPGGRRAARRTTRFVKADICDLREDAGNHSGSMPNRRGDTPRGGKPCRPVDPGPVHLRPDERQWEPLSLLQAAKELWNGDYEGKRFYHISTDEVYGALPS